MTLVESIGELTVRRSDGKVETLLTDVVIAAAPLRLIEATITLSPAQAGCWQRTVFVRNQ